MEEALDEAWDAGQRAWPSIRFARDRFGDYARPIGHEAIKRFPEDLYLAAACLGGEATAIRAFEDAILVEARGTIQAIDASPTFVEEVLQRVRSLMLVGNGAPRLAQYAGRGSLAAWVGVSAARVAMSLRRETKRSRDVLLDDEDWPRALARIVTNDPELELIKRQYADAFVNALRDATTSLESRLRRVLRMSFVDALSIDEIGELYSVHRATAARWVQRACDELFEKTRQLLAERLSLSSTELDRMTQMVRSQLDVSLSQLLPDAIE